VRPYNITLSNFSPLFNLSAQNIFKHISLLLKPTVKIMKTSSIFKSVLPIFVLFFIIVSCKKKDNEPNNEVIAQNFTNVAYGPNNRQKMDVYLPANRDVQNTKLFIWIHGGAWMEGDKSEFVNIKPSLDLNLSNYAYISLNYRLYNSDTQANRFPSQEEDIQLAIQFIKSKLTEWKISDKAVIAGASAGGHLALLQSYKHNSDGFIKSAISYFGPTELESFYPYNWFSILVLSGVTGGSPDQYPDLYYSSSPLNYINSNSVPTIFFHGTTDDVVPISQAYLLRDSLLSNGVTNDYLFVNGQGHGFSTATNIQTIQQAASFINQHNP